ncbi:RHS repeat-associated core domain-containing protein [Streptococcus cameli]
MAALYDGDDNRVFTASRKEGKHTYQLFQKQKKSPYTAPGGEEHSLFWYGFSQNVLQSLSALPQTVGTIWHDIFDDVSTAYHKKVAKDRANDEGLVVNPPSLGNLPGEGEVTYASQVKDVLIPYTTREDSFHYYEERNYVNDVNREHTEVLQTYDRELEAKETYTYGDDRVSYLDNAADKHYHYLTDQAGSVIGLTQDGNSVASSSYSLYGSTAETTDTTGNPFAYNGEARDITGLDYLRARYYDSSAGTFLTEDSYPGTSEEPLSQNQYSYVHNNPVNYTDPSGHIWKSIKKAASRAWNGVKKATTKTWNTVKRVANNTARAVVNGAKKAYNIGRNIVNTVVNTAKGVVNWVGTQVNRVTNWVGQQWNNIYHAGQQAYQSASDYAQAKYQQVQAQIQAQRQQAVRDEFTQATGLKDAPKGREGKNLLRNWGSALAKTLKHVCTTAKRVGKQIVKAAKKIDWKKVAVTAGAIGVGIALTVATGGLGVPVAMAIGGAASRVSPSKNAGFNHVIARHFNPTKNAGQFTISQAELKQILQQQFVIKSPVSYNPYSGSYTRTIDVGYKIGTIKRSLSNVGGLPTSKIIIHTDKLGNLITVYPIP